MPRYLNFCVCLTILTAFSLNAQEQPTADQQTILADVAKVEISNDFLPGAVCFFGEKSFPLVLTENIQGNGRNRTTIKTPLAAATRYEKGRIALFGHSGMIGKDFVETNKPLYYFLFRWLAPQKPGSDLTTAVPRIAVIGEQGTADLINTARRNVSIISNDSRASTSSPEYKADFFPNLTDAALSEEYDVLICGADRVRENQIEKVQQFVKNGGGLIIAATGWGWQQINPAKNLKTEFIGNKLTAPMGIVWTDQMAPQSDAGYLPATNSSPLLNPHNALETLQKKENADSLPKNDWAQLVSTLELALGSIPEEQAKAFSGLQDLVNRQVIPTKAKPIVAAEQPLDRLAMVLQTQKFMHAQARGGLPDGLVVPKFEAAADFPGDVPKDAPRIKEKTVGIDTKIPDWHSTGLYAAPGEVITVTIPEDAAKSGRFSVRIGALSDKLWHLARWERYPEISLTAQITKSVTKVANPFGGNVYVVVSRNIPADAKPISAKISGAVEAPYYVLGKTTGSQWSNSRKAPAPWAELESDKVIITVPSHLIRELDDPKAVLEFWNNVLDADAELVGTPIKRARPERITADRQISAGWMHSGYPVMTPTQTERGLVDLPYLHERGDRWGFFHEFGHNHQNRDWVFGGSTEVTVNLFTLNNFIHQCNTPIDTLRRETRPETRKAAKEKYLAEGAQFDKWKRDPFLALGMYIELIEEFGWDAFKKVFTEYRNLPANERPKNDDEKRDQWMCRFSKTVGKNLGPFFDQWGVPVSQSAKDSIANLPVWLPKE